MKHNIAKKVDFKLLTADGTNYALTAGTDVSMLNGSVLDMGTFKNVCLVVALGAITASGVITLRAKATDTPGSYGSGTIDQIGSDMTNSSAGEGDNKCLVLDFHNVKRKEVRLSLQRTAANVVVLSVLAIRYNGPNCPVYNGNADNVAVYSEPAASLT